MGYTHYWKFKKLKGKVNEANYQKAIAKCQGVVREYAKAHGGISGYTAHCKPGEYGGVNFNGSKDDGHETFILREHLNQNEAFNFCKTARKPYDGLVVACLIILKKYLGDGIEIGSDGFRADYIQGLNIARYYSGLKTLNIPDTIQTKRMLKAV